MACGLPVIGVRARALPEYINEKNGIIIEPDDYSALSENIIDLLNNPEKMQRLGIGGVEFVQKFSAESIANKWNDFYKKALNKKQ
jgi:glycosyltransferase involved in cell wall biosynthesis